MKRKDLETAVGIGDKSLEKFSILGPLIYDFPIPEGNQVEIFDLKFPSPLIGASFKSEKAIMSMWMRMGLGGTIYKTIMASERAEAITFALSLIKPDSASSSGASAN